LGERSGSITARATVTAVATESISSRGVATVTTIAAGYRRVG
jgi:hypothetical protein